LLVGYDLNSPGQDYENLIERLKAVGSNWWHHLDSTWLIKTTMSPKELREDLKPYVDADDELLVVDVTGASWAARGLSSYDWLQDNVY
jgi:hypothetical protein